MHFRDWVNINFFAMLVVESSVLLVTKQQYSLLFLVVRGETFSILENVT